MFVGEIVVVVVVPALQTLRIYIPEAVAGGAPKEVSTVTDKQEPIGSHYTDPEMQG